MDVPYAYATLLDALYLIAFSHVILSICKSCQHAHAIRFDSLRKLCLDLWILAHDNASNLLSKQKNTHASMQLEHRSYYDWNVKVREVETRPSHPRSKPKNVSRTTTTICASRWLFSCYRYVSRTIKIFLQHERHTMTANRKHVRHCARAHISTGFVEPLLLRYKRGARARAAVIYRVRRSIISQRKYHRVERDNCPCARATVRYTSRDH